MSLKLEVKLEFTPSITHISVEEALEFFQYYGSNQMTVLDSRYTSYILRKINYERLIISDRDMINKKPSLKVE